MEKRLQTVITILFALFLFIPLNPIMSYGENRADGDISITINLPDHEPVLNDGRPVMITGIINILNISFGGSYSSVNLTLYPENDLDEVKNRTNYYQWNFSEGDFSGRYDGEFIHEDMCGYGSDWVRFASGPYVLASEGEWILGIESDVGNTEKVVLFDSTRRNLGVSAPDFYFTTEPYSGEDYNSSSNRNYILTRNNGNIPLKLDFRYDKYPEYITTTNTSGLLDIGEERYHHLSFQTPRWGPDKVEITGTIRARPSYIINPATITLLPELEQTFSLTLEIRRAGFRLLDLGDVKIQYKESVNLKYDKTTYIDFYFTGWKKVDITPSNESIELKWVKKDNVTVNRNNIELFLTNDSESQLRFNIRGNKANTVGYLDCLLTSEDGTIEDNIVTEVVTGPAPNDGKEDTDPEEKSMAGIIFLALVFGFAFIFIAIILVKQKGVDKREIIEDETKNKD